MRYLEMIRRGGTAEVNKYLPKAYEEMASDLKKVVNKWGANGDLAILLAGLHKLLPLLEKNAPNENGLARILEENMGVMAISVDIPPKK